MLSDYHLHSKYSSDSTELPINIISAGIERNMKSLCFTDHMDYDYPINKNEPSLTFNLNINEYAQELESLRDDFSSKIDINIGIELGMQPHISIQNKKIINSYPFDFVIASTHIIDKQDPYYSAFWAEKDVFQSLHMYFEDILTSISTFDNFDVYGHLDYIIRYIPDKSFIFNYNDHKDIIDEILYKLISMRKGIEINSAGYRYNLGSPNPCIDIIKRYRQLGGKIITVGSDAHNSKDIGSNFEVIRHILMECGFDYYNTFKKREAIFHKL